MNKIKIGVDAFSYNNTIWSLCDYSGEQIYKKIALPLFYYQHNKLECLAASDISIADNSIDICVRENLYWNNGEAVNAWDYIRAILYVCLDSLNRYCQLLASVINHADFNDENNQQAIIAVNDYCIRIKTAWYDPFIPHYLSLINFSPRHLADCQLSAGPYQLTTTTDKSIQLSKNPFFCLFQSEDCIDVLEYCLIEEDKDGSAFFDNRIQVSCDTALSLVQIPKFQAHPDYHKGEELHAIILSPGNLFTQIPLQQLHQFTKLLDRKRIAKLYSNSLIPLYSWMQLYQIPFDKEVESDLLKETIELPQDKMTLQIAYEDFYPNLELLEHIAEDLDELNLSIKPIKENYGHWYSDCHLRLELRKIPKQNPMLLVRSDISRLAKESPYRQQLLKLYRQLFNIDNSENYNNIFSKIDGYIRMEKLYIPIFILPTAYFCHRDINANTLMSYGNHVLKKSI